jgi:hypothetical protein
MADASASRFFVEWSERLSEDEENALLADLDGRRR